MTPPPRPCRIPDCTTPAGDHKTVCHKHRHRIRHHGDPHFNTWTTADPTEVELLIHNPRPATGLTRLEQRLIAQGLTARGTTAAEIARLLHVTPRTVYRWRATA
jgi:DNA-binding CsgD family transcriptional regulator